MLTYVSPVIGISFGVIITLFGIYLLIRAHKNRATSKSESLKQWVERQNTKQKWMLFGIKVGIPIILILGFTIYANVKLDNIIYNPTLTLNWQVTITTDDIKQIDTANITFYLENTGNSAAYQMHTRIFSQPSTLQLTKLVNTKPYDVNGGPTPLQPKEKYYFPYFMQLPFEYTKSGEKVVESSQWYIYCRQEYSNTLNGGWWHLHTDEYWWVFNFKDKSLGNLNQEEISLFKKALNIEGHINN